MEEEGNARPAAPADGTKPDAAAAVAAAAAAQAQRPVLRPLSMADMKAAMKQVPRLACGRPLPPLWITGQNKLAAGSHSSF